ncbi:hypothetical protein GGU10DRAFT_332919 [Lentinula aff. detonsa]|uniref:DUF6533 domain-containing protein n=1 Tax=Lentinula aff. detonsa TaxID=2804958 RepID=A0AA38KQK7_9AGAR|nr:hypothetical protein GGU10DRAFT_332919 [Lentinula aff. detonsa]
MDVEISESTLTQESLKVLTPRLALSWDWNTVSSTVILFYDWILLLPEEIEFIWSAKLLRPFNALYNIQRYMPFIDTVALLYIVSFAEQIDVEKCRVLYNISGWMYIIGITLTEVVLTMRIWALWGKDTRLSIGLPLFFLSCWVPNFYIFHKFLQTETYIPSPLPQIIGCAILGGQPILYLCWVILVVYEAVLLILMLIQYRRQFSLTRVVYRDGITYYIILFLLSIINVATILLLPHDLQNLFTPPQRVIHTILTSRVVLHMRKQSGNQLQYNNDEAYYRQTMLKNTRDAEIKDFS